MSDALVVSEPRDLNMLWFLAHAHYWCPYAQGDCALFDDPLVRTFRGLPGTTSGVDVEAVKSLWAAQVRRHADAGWNWRNDANVWQHLPPAQRERVTQVDCLFHPLWTSHLGVAMALAWWNRTWGDLFRSTMSVEKWRAATSISAVDIIGAEDAVLKIGSWTAAGAIAMRSPQHLLDCLT